MAAKARKVSSFVLWSTTTNWNRPALINTARAASAASAPRLRVGMITAIGRSAPMAA